VINIALNRRRIRLSGFSSYWRVDSLFFFEGKCKTRPLAFTTWKDGCFGLSWPNWYYCRASDPRSGHGHLLWPVAAPLHWRGPGRRSRAPQKRDSKTWVEYEILDQKYGIRGWPARSGSARCRRGNQRIKQTAMTGDRKSWVDSHRNRMGPESYSGFPGQETLHTSWLISGKYVI